MTWLGDEDFLAGVNAHLTPHRFGNADLADFLDALDAATDRDVRGWAEAWLRTTGFDTLRVTRDGDVPVLHREARGRTGSVSGVRRRDGRGRLPAASTSPTSRCGCRSSPAGSWCPTRAARPSPVIARRAVVGRDHRPRRPSSIPPGPRDAVDPCFERPLDDLLDGGRPAPGRRGGPHPGPGCHRPRRQAGAPRRVAGRRRSRRLATGWPRRTAPVWPRPDEQLRPGAGPGAWPPRARDPDELHRWLDADRTDQEHDLDPRLRWRVVHRLAELGALDAEAIEAERRRDGTVEGDLGAATALAARPTTDAKAAAWAGMAENPEVSNRLFLALAGGLWSPEQARAGGGVRAGLGRRPRRGWPQRGSAFAAAVGSAFPALYLDDASSTWCATRCAATYPTVLRRAVGGRPR